MADIKTAKQLQDEEDKRTREEQERLWVFECCFAKIEYAEYFGRKSYICLGTAKDMFVKKPLFVAICSIYGNGCSLLGLLKLWSYTCACSICTF